MKVKKMTDFNIIQGNVEISNISTLLDAVDDARKSSPTGAVWLRGLSDASYSLLPSIGRFHKFAGKQMKFDKYMEQRFLHQFRRYSFAFYGRTLNEWEALFVARHHGLPVRLLDWSANPLSALFFACEYWSTELPPDAKIWLLVPSKHIPDSYINIFDVAIGPFDVQGIRLIYPMEVAPRLNAQSALFTIQQDPWTPLDKTDVSRLPDSCVDVLTLIEYPIPAKSKGYLLKELNDLQISRRTLFPDLDGLSSGLVSAEILRSRKPIL
jgi:hypothetical protein